MKWLPLCLGAAVGMGLGVIYLTQFSYDEEEWAFAPANSAEWRDHQAVQVQPLYDASVLQDELASRSKLKPAPSDVLLSEDDLAALLEQEQSEVD